MQNPMSQLLVHQLRVIIIKEKPIHLKVIQKIKEVWLKKKESKKQLLIAEAVDQHFQANIKRKNAKETIQKEELVNNIFNCKQKYNLSDTIVIQSETINNLMEQNTTRMNGVKAPLLSYQSQTNIEAQEH
jgi:hypothetical protein